MTCRSSSPAMSHGLKSQTHSPKRARRTVHKALRECVASRNRTVKYHRGQLAGSRHEVRSGVIRQVRRGSGALQAGRSATSSICDAAPEIHLPWRGLYLPGQNQVGNEDCTLSYSSFCSAQFRLALCDLATQDAKQHAEGISWQRRQFQHAVSPQPFQYRRNRLVNGGQFERNRCL